MIPVLSAAQARAFDAFVAEACAVPSLLLMENAGRSAALVAAERLPAGADVLCVCGAGNNGGDGYVVARQLALLGHRVQVASLVRDAELRGDAAINAAAWRGVGGAVREVLEDADVEAVLAPLIGRAALVVDGLFGTGLSRELTGRYRAAVERINALERPVLALDLPSGLHADTGAVLGAAVRADVTVTFGHPKPGLLTSRAADLVGELRIGPLGVSPELGPGREPTAYWLEPTDVASLAARRTASAHKGSSGRVLVIAGSVGKSGAALLAGTAALRGGAGLVTLATFAEAARSLDQRVIELMTEPLDAERPAASLARLLEGVDAVVVGPGLGMNAAARGVVEHVVRHFDGPKVLDADAVSHYAGRGAELAGAPGSCLLTPHPGELGRLLGTSAAQIEGDRFAAIEEAVRVTGQTVLLKGPHTLIAAPGGPPWVSSAGHPVLASGGSGDVLAGLCGACSVGLPPRQAAALAAQLHGRAARLWVAAHAGADRGLLARELCDLLPEARAELCGVRAAPRAAQ